MESYKEVIERLNRYDLSKFPYEEIKKDIGLLAKFGSMAVILRNGKSMTRARLNDEESPFSNRGALQYIPKSKNKRFARASSPNNTMFYASVIPDEVNDKDYDNSRVTATIEVSKFIHPNSKIISGEEKLTYSRWTVKGNILLLAICYYKDFVTKSPHTSELFNAYSEHLKEVPPELVEKSLAVTDFLAHQFAKPNLDEIEYEYLISAAFTEMAVNKQEIGGIYYPSVKADGLGFNVAIFPEVVDKYLKLDAVGECTIYKEPDHIVIDNDTVCLIEDDSKPFVLEPVRSEDHMGRDKVMEHIARARLKGQLY